MKEIKIGKHHAYMALTGDGYFDLREILGDEIDVFEKLMPNTREAFNLTCLVAAALCEGGELQRRASGHDPQPILSAGAIRVLTKPMDIVELKKAVFETINEGLKREHKDENDRRDLILEELEGRKK